MVTNDLIILRRKEMVVNAAIVIAAVCLFIALFISDTAIQGSTVTAGIVSGWILAAYWVELDNSYRGNRRFVWTVFTLVTGPLGLLMYLLSRPHVPAVCSQCGAAIVDSKEPCPACGHQSLWGRVEGAVNRVYLSLLDSFAHGPVEKARDLTKQMAIALAAVFVFLMLILPSLPHALGMALRVLWIFSAAGYWVLTAWWVYLDATWRRMDPMPWGILTLVTNVFGLVTYLVTRYPDPRACPQCGAYLTVGLKRCPYCGSESEPSCPKCQASVKPDWAFCPSCAAKLPVTQGAATVSTDLDAPSAPAVVSIRGTVVDASTGSPISGAQIMIDSKFDSIVTSTDDSGKFVLTDLEPRPYVVTAEAPGFSRDSKAFRPGTAPAPMHFALYPVEE